MRLCVGRIGRPHGIKGEATIEVRTDEPEKRFANGAIIATDNRGSFEVESTRNHNGILLLKLVGIDDRNGIGALRNSLLYCDVDVEEESVNPDEYHFQQLIGCSVELENGRDFGKVKDVMDMPAQAVLVIQSHEKEVMVPFVKVWVPTVDIANKKIVIREP
jgi:16S rRNA processing protein RimM